MPQKTLRRCVNNTQTGLSFSWLIGIGFGSFNTARRTLRGYETMNMLRKGQVQGVTKGDIRAQAEFVSQIFGVAA